MTRVIVRDMRDDMDDLLTGLDAGTLDYFEALKHLRIQLLEGLKDPLVGAVDVTNTKAMIKTDDVVVPPHLRKTKGKPRRGT